MNPNGNEYLNDEPTGNTGVAVPRDVRQTDDLRSVRQQFKDGVIDTYVAGLECLAGRLGTEWVTLQLLRYVQSFRVERASADLLLTTVLDRLERSQRDEESRGLTDTFTGLTDDFLEAIEELY
jgi:hypothetical protein